MSAAPKCIFCSEPKYVLVVILTPFSPGDRVHFVKFNRMVEIGLQFIVSYLMKTAYLGALENCGLCDFFSIPNLDTPIGSSQMK